MYFRTQAAIDLDAVEFNIKNTRKKLAPGVKLLAVLKADAYGHGALMLAKEFEKEFDFIGVACIEEALELVKAGIKTPLIILGTVAPPLLEKVVQYNIRIPVFTYEAALALSEEAQRQGKTVPFHFCVDTGMSRIGLQVNAESADMCARIIRMKGIYAEGIFSHLATADEEDLHKAKVQVEHFRKFNSMLLDRGIDPPIKHINNSAAIMNFSECFNMCRMGIITYGLYPSAQVNKSLLEIRPAMCWKTHISHIKTLPPGREISYGGTFVTKRETVVATIPVGYADGYPRALSNRGRVIICGKYADIIGRVCMDQFMVDITDIPEARTDSEVILVGKSGKAELSMEQVSEAAYSFNYELPCRVSRRVPRVYYRNGIIVEASNYLY